jgi:hypothetical protein
MRLTIEERDEVAEALDGWHDETAHAYPKFGREHTTDGGPCWCIPILEPQPRGNTLVIHRGMN